MNYIKMVVSQHFVFDIVVSSSTVSANCNVYKPSDSVFSQKQSFPVPCHYCDSEITVVGENSFDKCFVFLI